VAPRRRATTRTRQQGAAALGDVHAGLIGLLAILPAVMLLGGYGITGADAASVFCVLWILKVGLHAPAFEHAARVVSNERAPIASVLILFAILLMIAATAAHMFERVRSPSSSAAAERHVVGGRDADHDGLRRRGAADAGRTPGRSLLMISGIAVLALMTGVLATGFAQEERRASISGCGKQVARVPLFLAGCRHPVGDRGQAAHALLPRRASPWWRRGDAGDSMFFISSGEVEVRLPNGGSCGWAKELLRRDGPARAPAAHRVGGDHQADDASVLYSSDFNEIASHIPKLAEASKRGQTAARGELERQRRQGDERGPVPGAIGRPAPRL
jgi:voltage-gated potassium channel